MIDNETLNLAIAIAKSMSSGGGGEGAVIDDSTTSSSKVWSSQKVSDELANIPSTDVIDDTTTALDKTWSSSKINGLLILDVTNVGV